MGYHYDTFGYIEIDREVARAKFDAAGKTLHLPPIGGSLEVWSEPLIFLWKLLGRPAPINYERSSRNHVGVGAG